MNKIERPTNVVYIWRQCKALFIFRFCPRKNNESSLRGFFLSRRHTPYGMYESKKQLITFIIKH